MAKRACLRKPLAEYALSATNLWSTHPDLCWALEQTITLRAPDEPAARAKSLKKNPDEQKRRDELRELKSREMFPPNPTTTTRPPDHSSSLDCAAIRGPGPRP